MYWHWLLYMHRLICWETCLLTGANVHYVANSLNVFFAKSEKTRPLKNINKFPNSNKRAALLMFWVSCRACCLSNRYKLPQFSQCPHKRHDQMSCFSNSTYFQCCCLGKSSFFPVPPASEEARHSMISRRPLSVCFQPLPIPFKLKRYWRLKVKKWEHSRRWFIQGMMKRGTDERFIWSSCIQLIVQYRVGI